MARIAALFPGQGSQYVGMGRDLAQRWPLAAAVFADVDAGLRTDLSTLCWYGPEEELRLTTNTQPALLTHSVAAWRVLSKQGFSCEAVAGHSLGEYSAVVAAGGLGVVDAARSVRERGRLMQAAVPVGDGAMAAVLGLDDDVVVELCREITANGGEPVVAANLNSPGQVVISGTTAAVDRAIEASKGKGARRALPLPVSAPFHSPLMAPAREGLEPVLGELGFVDLKVPVYRNVDADPVTTADEVRDGLIRQVDAPVLWSQTIRRMTADGFDTFVEVGAGGVLSGLVKRIDRSATCYQAGTVEGIEKVLAELVA
ncbi:MAG: ACP S-malonyltransferase [Thermoanaerobaculales bacterium]|jgi:[acyl-carrier-protein] S-malonyltransferase|nr:ACP S-malonyltransferase [Thermoanaerobaculales bacterium]